MPYKSKAQQRFFYAAEARGEMPKGTANRWSKHTKNIAKLPEYAEESDEQKKAQFLAKVASVMQAHRDAMVSTLCSYLDTVASSMPLQKTASIREVQQQLSLGRTIQDAIKTAYPSFSADKVQEITERLVRNASRWAKRT